jgi:hypothetical protein
MFAHEAGSSPFASFAVTAPASDVSRNRSKPSDPAKVPDFVGTLLFRGSLFQVYAAYDLAYEFVKQKTDEEGYPPNNVAQVVAQMNQLDGRRQALINSAVTDGNLTQVTAVIADTLGWFRLKQTDPTYPQERVTSFCKPLDALRLRQVRLRREEAALVADQPAESPRKPAARASRPRRSSGSKKTTAEIAVTVQG